MNTHRNIFACLVHEKVDCILDLVRNLNYLDPNSLILLYNGGRESDLLDINFSWEKYGAVQHPEPSPMKWGTLHGFALDCMEFALAQYEFDTMTIVDSDQLSVRKGYTEFLTTFLEGQNQVGMLVNVPEVQPKITTVGPAKAAWKEYELWKSFLQQFPRGEEKFVHWSFWPSTVFTHEAVKQLVQLFQNKSELQTIMNRTSIWATEEVVFPTLVSLVGLRLLRSPLSYECVKYRARYSLGKLQRVMEKEDVYWVHPVNRSYNNNLRQYIRSHFQEYAYTKSSHAIREHPAPEPDPLHRLSIINQMKNIEGWLSDEEADLLIDTTEKVLTEHPDGANIIEVGSYCGRSTIVFGKVIQQLEASARIYAIDPHTGRVGAEDQQILQKGPTLGRFQQNLKKYGINEFVELIQSHSYQVAWNEPVHLLFIDGLHDYLNVSRDFNHFAGWVVEGGYILLHDYADYYPGVKIFVDELLTTDDYTKVDCAGSMILLRKAVTPSGESKQELEPDRHIREAKKSQVIQRIESDQLIVVRVNNTTLPGIVQAPENSEKPAIPFKTHKNDTSVRDAGRKEQFDISGRAGKKPLVSCIMPTANRRRFVPQSIRYFLRQDYARKELLILDDGSDPIEDVVPDDARIRYIRLSEDLSLGAKRNYACEKARGEVIIHWDDDDWMADWRIDYQVTALLKENADVCGINRIYYFNPAEHQAWQYVYPENAKPWVGGNTLCYKKSFWCTNPFPDISIGEDTRFIWKDTAKRITFLPDVDFFVGLIHTRNTSRKRTSSRRWKPLAVSKIQELVRQDWEFYCPQSQVPEVE